MRVASIDLGSNSFLLSIAEKDASGMRLLLDECSVVGLAKRLTTEGRVSEDAMKRAKNCLKRYREKLDEFEVEEVIAVATESLRRPSNSEEVRDQLSDFLGQNIQIISPQREAELSFWSVQKDPLCPPGTKIVFDIGGASTELIRGEAEGVQELCSLKLGSVVLTEKFGLEKKGSYEKALNFVIDELNKCPVTNIEPSIGVGVAGTVTSLLAAEMKFQTYDRNLVHGRSLSFDKIESWLRYIFSLELEDRFTITGLPKERADVFAGGVLIIMALAKHFGWKEILCFDTGVRFGLLYEKLLS